MDNRTIGERDQAHQQWIKGWRRMGGGPRLVVDNTCPLPRRQQQAIRGIRIINGDEGGPPDAA